MDQPVLVVDLDGTLIHTDMLHESALKLFRDRPLDTLRIPLWLSRGKAVLKEQLASRTHVDPKTLPYNTALLSWLKSQKSEGRRLVLCTASDRSIADGIARHVDLFDEVIASDGTLNLAGPQKAQALVARFGDRGFDYAGNSEADLATPGKPSWWRPLPDWSGRRLPSARSRRCSSAAPPALQPGDAYCACTSG